MTPYHDTPVLEFHRVFGSPVNCMPGIPPQGRRLLRLKLIFEEFLEFVEASGFELALADHNFEEGRGLKLEHFMFNRLDEACNIAEAADALGDLRVVVDGSNLEWGFPGEYVLQEIHRSNMSKLNVNGQPLLREDGKILKGPNYKPPNILAVLARAKAGWLGSTV